MIEAHGLTKRFGEKLAVDDLQFTARPGVVTGFLGPNGAGKSTTMRMIVGLDRPTSGSVAVNGHRYDDTPAPLHEVGALLEARAMHAGRTARNHLRVLAATCGIPDRRADEMLELVGLAEVADKRAGTFSMGMGQRLGIAAALLGDPHTIVLDEPGNGLDPEGILWVRNLLRQLAAEGRTVFVSSHLMAEMALTADRLIVIGRGRTIAEGTVDEITGRAATAPVRVRSPRADRLVPLLAAPDVSVSAVAEDGGFEVTGLTTDQIGDIAAENGVAIHELTRRAASLEQVFMELTQDAVEYGAGR